MTFARTPIAALGLFVLVAFARQAHAGSCGDGTCDPGETAQNCAQDCLCQNTAEVDYGLCCCCSNGPNPQGQCTPKAICNYPAIGACDCCAQLDPQDPLNCLVCVGKDPIQDWCGGLGAYEGMGSCGPAAPTVCPDTEMTDDYVDGVNLRTRCALTEIDLGTVEVGNVLSLPVSLVINEGRPPPIEVIGSVANSIARNTGPYGIGGWMSTDRLITDEGVYWPNTDDKGMPSVAPAMKGKRGDRNGNGYVGYTLHTPYGTRTYDYPVVIALDGKKVGAFRSEPFDGKYLIVEQRAQFDPTVGRRYTLFSYPNGPFEIYDYPISSPFKGNFPSEFVNTSMLSSIKANFGPPKKEGQDGFEPKEIHISRFDSTLLKPGDGVFASNATRSVGAQVDITEGASIELADFQDQPDGGLKVRVDSKPSKTSMTLLMTAKAGFHVETWTRPGRSDDDVITFSWDKLAVASIDTQSFATMKSTSQSTFSFTRDMGAPTVASVKRSMAALGVSEGDETTLFEGCDLDGKAFSGTTVSMPRDLRWTFEYGDESINHRVKAVTNPLGLRTQYVYNDKNTEPRGEMTDSAVVAAATDDAGVAKGSGTHVDWVFVEQSPLDKALFAADTFAGPAASKGVPVPSAMKRLPDGATQQKLLKYDKNLFLPTQIVDARGFRHDLGYYADTAQLKTYTKRGVTTSWIRSFTSNFQSTRYSQGYTFLVLDTRIQGPKGGSVSVGSKAFDHAGRLFSDISTGLRFKGDEIGSGKTEPITIEKRFERGDFMAPSKLQTWVNGKMIAETVIAWDGRLRGAKSSSGSANGTAVSDVAPKGGKVDGRGDPVGDWKTTAFGDSLAVSQQLDPLGNILSASVNGVGAKLTYSGAPMGFKLTMASSTPAGDATIGEEIQSTGTTSKVCK